MPIQETTKMDVREEMAILALDGRLSVREIAERFGVSPPTVRLWRERYRELGRSGLEDRSHAPHSCPHKTPTEIEELILAERIRWGYGSKKIRRRLQDRYPGLELPSRAAVDAMFNRAGLVQPRLSRHRGQTPFARSYAAKAPGDLMTIDFKGQFRLRNGHYCYPLTLMDYTSRFLLECRGLRSTALDGVWKALVTVFREHGLPKALLSDNGVPFAPPNHARLSTMSVRLMQLDTQPVFSRPGHPEDNGVHERMHLDLKATATRPPEASFQKQQERFDLFRREYNEERPHEALDLDRPVSRFKASPRKMPSKIEKPDYPLHFEKRKVCSMGTFKWNSQKLFIGQPLAGEYIGLEPVDERYQNIYYYNFLIGKLDEEAGEVI